MFPIADTFNTLVVCVFSVDKLMNKHNEYYCYNLSCCEKKLQKNMIV